MTKINNTQRPVEPLHFAVEVLPEKLRLEQSSHGIRRLLCNWVACLETGAAGYEGTGGFNSAAFYSRRRTELVFVEVPADELANGDVS